MNLKYSFFELISTDKNLFDLFCAIESISDLYLIGGGVRNFLENSHKFENKNLPKDFDFIVDNVNLDFLLNLHKINYKQNKFGGFKIEKGTFSFDLWNLKDTFAFKYKFLKSKVRNIDKSVFLNFDGIFYSFTEDRFCQNFYKETIKENCLDLILPINPLIYLNLVRIIDFVEKYEFKVSKRIKNLFRKFEKDKNFIDDLVKIHNFRYKNKNFNTFCLEKILNSA